MANIVKIIRGGVVYQRFTTPDGNIIEWPRRDILIKGNVPGMKKS